MFGLHFVKCSSCLKLKFQAIPIVLHSARLHMHKNSMFSKRLWNETYNEKEEESFLVSDVLYYFLRIHCLLPMHSFVWCLTIFTHRHKQRAFVHVFFFEKKTYKCWIFRFVFLSFAFIVALSRRRCNATTSTTPTVWIFCLFIFLCSEELFALSLAAVWPVSLFLCFVLLLIHFQFSSSSSPV